MPYFVLYTALILMGSFFSGALMACLIRKYLGGRAYPALETAASGMAGAAATPVAFEKRADNELFGDRAPADQSLLDREALKDDPVAHKDSGLETVENDRQYEADPIVHDVGDPVGQVSLTGSERAPEEPVGTEAAAAAASAAAIAASRAAEVVSADEESEAPFEEEAVAAQQEEPPSTEEPVPSPESDASEAAENELSPGQEGIHAGDADPEEVARSGSESTDGSEDETGSVGAGGSIDAPRVSEDIASRTGAVAETADATGEATGSTAATDAAAAVVAGGIAASTVQPAGADDDRPPVSPPDEVVGEQETVVDTASVVPDAAPDDLLRIRGIDDETSRALNNAGFSRYDQLAQLSPAGVAGLDGVVGSPARISREGWIEQASILATGQETHYSKRQYKKSSGRGASGSQSADAGTGSEAVTTAAASVGGLAGAVVHTIMPGLEEAPSKEETASGNEKSVEAGDSTTELQDRRPETVVHQDDNIRDDHDPHEARLPGDGGEENDPGEVIESREDSGFSDSGEAGEPREASEPREVREPREPVEDPVQSGASHETGPGRQQGNPGALRSTRSGRTAGGNAPGQQRRVVGGGAMLQSGEPDDLKRIRGVGVVIEKKLNAMGIHSYSQVAAWDGEDIERVNAVLDFSGRIERENWIEQARMLVTNS